MQEHQKKAFDFASDLTKQIITLAVAVVTLAIGNLDALAELHQTPWMIATLIAYTISIVFGIFTLMFLTGSLDLKNRNKSIEADNAKITTWNAKPKNQKKQKNLIPELKENDLSIYIPKVTNPMSVQLVAFAAAVLLTIVFSVQALIHPSPPQNKNIYVLDKTGYDSTVVPAKNADTVFIIKTPNKNLPGN